MQSDINTYTFFKKGLKMRSALIFVGEHEHIPTDGDEPETPLYNIEMEKRSFELIQNTPSVTRKVLTGNYQGFLRLKALIRSEHGLSSAHRNGTFSKGWTFVYMSNKYKWTTTGALSKAWTLVDINDREIATFSRALFKPRRIGMLEIHNQQTGALDPDFVALILLTCKFVHNTVKSHEHHASN